MSTRPYRLRQMTSPLFVLALAAAGIGSSVLRGAASEHPALAALDAYIEGWNSRDAGRWTATLHFPHTRQSTAGGELWSGAEEYANEVDWSPLIESGWEKSAWDSVEIIHAGPDKAHVAGVWSRFDGEGRRLLTNQVTYVVNEEEGSWGVRARFAAGPPVDAETAAASEAAALHTVEEYMDAFNARDPVAWAATLNYPHVRVASGEIQTWASAEEYARWMDFDRFVQQTGWNRSQWDAVRAVQVSSDAVNVALDFTRFDDQGQVLASYKTLYLVTRQDGHWGVRARSSFAP